MNLSNRWKGIMKCYPFEEKRLAKWKPPYIVQPKYDGVRCRAVHTPSGYILVSSEENVIFSVPHINRALNALQITDELDGELYHHTSSFESIVSITSRSVNLHPDYKMIGFHIFDVINERLQIERTVSIEKLKNQSDHLIVSPFWLCQSLDEIISTFNYLINLGYEGIIVRHFQAFYEHKRSTYIMKFKPKQSDVYEICGFEEEISISGNPKSRLGALKCWSGDGHLFNVGTGFNDEMREQLWTDRSELKGKKVKISYQHLTSGKKVPRFPVFVEVIE